MLLGVLVLDGGILGMAMGVMRAQSPEYGAGVRRAQSPEYGVDVRSAQSPEYGVDVLREQAVVHGTEELHGQSTVYREDHLRAWSASIQADGGGPENVLPEAMKPVALTFDDGPHAVCTERLLNGLKERGVRATFFLMGENIAGNEALVRRMADEGHLIGNHSYRHVQLTKAGADVVCEAVEETGDLIGSITGSSPQYLRPPYGDWNEELECRLDLTTVFWSLDSLDWSYQNTARIVRRIEERVEGGDIILMHDIFPTSVEAALELIDRLEAKGYTFVTVDDLLID